MIDNLIDAIDSIVTDMQDVVTNTDNTTVLSDITTFHYHTTNNIYQAGMWVEFTFPTSNIGTRYKIATFVKNSANEYTITINSTVPNVSGIKNVTMRPFIKYKYDNYKNIQKQLIEEGKAATLKRNKYPLLALVLPYEEDREKEPGIIFETNATIVLIIDSQKDWTTAERESYSFEQNLRPLYDLFISKVKLSGLFQTDENLLIQHKKTDHYFWSADKAQDQNKLAAIVDAIELSNLKLILNKQSNC